MGEGSPTRSRALAVLCLASAAWGFSFGLSLPLGALWLERAGWSASSVGLASTFYYLGIAATAPFLPFLLRRSGRPLVVGGMALDGITIACFPLVDTLTAWLVLRFLGGAATALSIIPMETLVGQNAPPGARARHFGIYAFCVALGIGLGPVLGLPLFSVAPRLTFLLAGAIAGVTGLWLIWSLPPGPLHEEASSLGPAFSWRGSSLGLGTGCIQGFLEGGMLTFLSGYLLGAGYDETAASCLLAALFLGVVLLQLPAAWAADRVGSRAAVLTCHLVVILGLGVLPVIRAPYLLGLGLFCVGGCCAALYPLGLALLGERSPAASFASASSWYLVWNGVGCLAGPWVLGRAIDLLGPQALFSTALALVALLLVACLGVQRHADGVPPVRDLAGDMDSRRAA